VNNSDIDVYEVLNDLAKRRGFYWISYEIYGGVSGLYDFGPIGVLIKRNIMNEWINNMVYNCDLIVEIETPIITPRVVLQASGHEEHFTDPVVECTKCGRVFRADHLIEEKTGLNVEGAVLEELHRIIIENRIKCPECGGELSKPDKALLLFKTEIGPFKGIEGYIRPEAAQGMFVSFKHVLNAVRNRLPLGIAQIGRVGRNEISPRQGLIRLREFTIMEFEFFFDPEESFKEVMEIMDSRTAEEELYVLTISDKDRDIDKPSKYTTIELINEKIVKNPWLAYWMARGNIFLKEIGIPGDLIKFEEKYPWERAHYSEQTFDQLVYTKKFKWIEVAGYSYRTKYDLDRHMKYSNADLTYFKKYDKPLEKRIIKVIPNIDILKNIAGDKIGLIIDKIKNIDQEILLNTLREGKCVKIDDYCLDREAFIVKEEIVKIHGEKIIPHVVEPSFGLERLFYVVLENSLTITQDNKIVLRLKPSIAPYQVAVFPLVTGREGVREKITRISRTIYNELLKARIRAYYDDEGSIGKRYVRADEIGIPYAITVDYQTIEDKTVTIRFRDTREQIRVSLEQLYDKILELLGLKHSIKIEI